jgi:hypothetical protein
MTEEIKISRKLLERVVEVLNGAAYNHDAYYWGLLQAHFKLKRSDEWHTMPAGEIAPLIEAMDRIRADKLQAPENLAEELKIILIDSNPTSPTLTRIQTSLH